MASTPLAAPLRFDHVGIVVPDIAEAIALFRASFGVSEITDRFDDDGLRVSVQFVRDLSGMTYEMITPRGGGSPVAKALASNNNLLNQVAYRVSDLTLGAEALRQAGHLPLGKPSPAVAFGGARVQFFWSRFEFVIELVEGFEALPVFRKADPS